jgi:pimeloyl-ACP methyl ester carboxylesterase
MTAKKPTIVLIPGAWHTADCYEILIPHLHEAGYETLPLTLPSVGADPAQQSLDPDVQHIRNNVIPLLDQGKDVVLAMHSYGGVPGSSAMRGLAKNERQAQGQPGGVTALVFICAWMIDEGTTAKDYGGGRGGKLGPSTLSIEVCCFTLETTLC